MPTNKGYAPLIIAKDNGNLKEGLALLIDLPGQSQALQAPEPRTPPAPTDPVAALPLWQRILLARVQGGMPIEDARLLEGSKVSPAIIKAAREQYPAFKAALEQLAIGKALSIDAREVARAFGTAMVMDAVDASRDTVNERGADRLGNRRLVLEAGQYVGGASRESGAGMGAVTIEVVTVTAEQLAQRVRVQVKPTKD